jgi:hypothetical protein
VVGRKIGLERVKVPSPNPNIFHFHTVPSIRMFGRILGNSNQLILSSYGRKFSFTSTMTFPSVTLISQTFLSLSLSLFGVSRKFVFLLMIAHKNAFPLHFSNNVIRKTIIWRYHIDDLPGELQLHFSLLYGNKVTISWPVVLPNIHVITVVSNHDLFTGCYSVCTPDIIDMILNYFIRHCKLKCTTKPFGSTLL